MKKLLISTFMLTGFLAVSQLNRTIRYGIYAGLHENSSQWAGGMDQASGRFHSNPFPGIALGFHARFDACERMSFVSGLGFYTWGFDYSLYQNYSFSRSTAQVPYAHVELQSLELPFMAYLNGKTDCRNARWVIGTGFSAVVNSAVSHSVFVDPANEGNAKAGFSTTVHVPGGARAYLRLSAGREWLTKKGGIFHVELTAAIGLKEAARAQVGYLDQGNRYEHEFSNKGNYTGVRFVFYFGRLNKQLILRK